MTRQELLFDSLDAAARHDRLARFDILDTPPEDGFDELVRLAAQICDTPIATITFIDGDRQWFKARVGFAMSETPLVRSICADTLVEPGVLVIPDLARDARTSANPAVTEAPHLRFYARARLQTGDGVPLGTLCVIDTAPRPAGLAQEQLSALAMLARQVMSQMELRLAVTEREARAADLRASEARLRAVFEASYQVQAFLAADGTLLDANARALDLVGASLAEVVGRKLWDTPWYAATPGMDEIVHALVAKVGEGQPVRREMALDLPGGRRVLDVTFRPVAGDAAASPAGEGALGGIVLEGVDLTERRRTEALLHQSQKMEAVGQLTGGIAHDFNNMLSIVTGYLGLARRRLSAPGDAGILKCIDNATEGANRAIALTKRLLAFARAQPLDARALDVNSAVTQIAGLLRRTLGEAIRIETTLEPSLWLVHAETAQIESALVNLAVNGRDAMPDGGTLTIGTENVDLDEAAGIASGGGGAGQFVRLSVRDTGCGMAADVIERAFDPFFTTKPVGRGTGLGLSQVFGFAKQSGGHVRLRSDLGAGTTAEIFLPRHVETLAEVQARTPAAASAPAANRAVLLVEDEAEVRRMTADSLAELGYTVVQAGSPAAALEQLDTRDDIAMMVTDVVMPEMSGRDLAALATKRRPELRVLFATGCTRDAQARQELASAGAGLIAKPFTLEQLGDSMRQAFGG